VIEETQGVQSGATQLGGWEEKEGRNGMDGIFVGPSHRPCDAPVALLLGTGQWRPTLAGFAASKPGMSKVQVSPASVQSRICPQKSQRQSIGKSSGGWNGTEKILIVCPIKGTAM
jgi:hypothetical protein